MRLLWAILMSLCATLSATAERHELASAGADACGCDIHVRSSAGKWSLLWDYTDDQNYMAAEVSHDSPFVDEISGVNVTVELSRTHDGHKTILGKESVNMPHDEFSIRLWSDAYGSAIYCGDGRRLNINDIEIELPYGSKIFYESDSREKPGIMWASVEELPQAQRSKFSNLKSLEGYLAASTDPLEGIWRYLDRDFSSEAIVLGGQYILALVRGNAPGEYDILYISGSDNHPGHWAPLDIKGRLHATKFIGMYDAEWHDSSRRLHGKQEEVHAQQDGGVLKITFPLVNSSLRFGIESRSAIHKWLNE